MATSKRLRYGHDLLSLRTLRNLCGIALIAVFWTTQERGLLADDPVQCGSPTCNPQNPHQLGVTCSFDNSVYDPGWDTRYYMGCSESYAYYESTVCSYYGYDVYLIHNYCWEGYPVDGSFDCIWYNYEECS